MNIPRLRHGFEFFVLVGFVDVFVTLSSAYGQCRLTEAYGWNVTQGNWNVATNRSSSGVPNSSGTNVCVMNGTAGTPANAVLNIGVSTTDLQLGSNNSLSINNGLAVIEGPSAGQFGLTNASGPLSLGVGRTLNLSQSTSVLNGATVTPVGTQPTIMTGAAKSGTFS